MGCKKSKEPFILVHVFVGAFGDFVTTAVEL